MSYLAERVTCPKCGALPDEPCMRLRRTGWRPIPRYQDPAWLRRHMIAWARLSGSHPARVRAGEEHWEREYRGRRDAYYVARDAARMAELDAALDDDG